MCGITGIVNPDKALAPEREAVLRMLGALRHRGPDEFGLYRDRHAALGHARLSIIDIATGQQPMAAPEISTWIVFNGEIFNYVELRHELENRNHRFRTASDTEVFLRSWMEWGYGCFERFNGQWAVALWDATQRKLVLSRDAAGIAPLYLCEFRGTLYFASEVKAIFAASPDIPRAFDPVGLDQVFTFWANVAPVTIFAGIEELQPGEIRTYQGARVQRSFHHAQAFPPDRPRFSGSLDSATTAVGEALETASALRLTRSDVPVGCYLSGGLDSSLIAALGRRHAGAHFHTFSLRFAEAEYDESPYQHAVAQSIGSEHHELVIQHRDIAQHFSDAVHHGERPILRTAPVPMYLLSREVQACGIKVVLTGEGADEAFAGYDLFREGKVRRFWARDPASRLRPRLLERLYPYLSRSPVARGAMARRFFGANLENAGQPGFAHDTRWRTTAALKRLFAPDLAHALAGRDAIAGFLGELPPHFRDWSALAQDQHIECKTLLAGYLLAAQGDRMLMAHSIEGRFPFLDENVLALADALPDDYKLRVLDEKHMLKRLGVDLLPGAVVARKKQPYRAPDGVALCGPDAPAEFEEALTHAAVEQAGVFAPAAVDRIWQKLRRRTAEDASLQLSNADNMAICGILSTQLIHRRLIARTPPQHVPSIALRVDVDHTEARSSIPHRSGSV